jgi:hypothetical protein
MSFSEALKTAADVSFRKSPAEYNEIIQPLNAGTCPSESPKELLTDLTNKVNTALGKRVGTSKMMDAIYNASKSGYRSQDLNAFIDHIKAEINSDGSLPQSVAKNFETASKAQTVRRALDNIFRRVQYHTSVGTPVSGLDVDGSTTINLVCRLQQTTGDSVEDAIRHVFFDIRKARKFHGRADLVVGNKIIEIKYSRSGFSSLATDSQALKPIENKWYLYVAGDVSMNKAGQLRAWFINSIDLYEALKPLASAGGVAPIDIANPDQRDRALSEIENEIDQIKGELARAILNKSMSGPEDDQMPHMSLQRRVGVNRVRFDLKFEALLRDYVSEILRG